MSVYVPRAIPKEERRIIVDALLRAAADSRALISRMSAASSKLDPVAIARQLDSMQKLASDQERLASNLDDSSLDIKLVREAHTMPHERISNIRK